MSHQQNSHRGFFSKARLHGSIAQFGNSTSYANFDSTGDLSLVGDAIAWDDIRVPLSSIKRLGFTDPDWVQFQDDGSGSTGVYALAFDKDTDEEVFFDIQLPHNWKLGTDLHPHVHWAPSNTNTGDVTWKLEYTIATPGAVFGNTVFLSGTQAGSGSALNHQAIDLSDIDMSAYVNVLDISIMLICRLFRDVSDADDYNADAFLLEIDFHYQIDTLGSNAELSK